MEKMDKRNDWKSFRYMNPKPSFKWILNGCNKNIGHMWMSRSFILDSLISFLLCQVMIVKCDLRN